MAVLIRHRAEGMTEAQYDEISPPLVEKLKTQPGFLFHTAFTDNGQFTVSEIWESQEQHDQWFDANVAPNLPWADQLVVVPLISVHPPLAGHGGGVRRGTARTRTAAATTGAIREATRNGGPEFQGVARNQPTSGRVPITTIAARRLGSCTAAINAAAPTRVKRPSPIEIPRS